MADRHRNDLRIMTERIIAVQNHGVPKEVTDALFRESKTFFDLPEDVKLQTEVMLSSS